MTARPTVTSVLVVSALLAKRVHYLTVLLSLASAATLTGCGGGATGPSDNYSGTYTLRTIGGQSLPFIDFQAGADKTEWTSDSLSLADNGTNGGAFTEIRTHRVTTSGQIHTSRGTGAGTYTRNGAAVSLTYNLQPAGKGGTGTIGGGTLTIIAEVVPGAPQVSLVYQK